MTEQELITRPSGEWVKRKYWYLRRYCDIFTRGMRKKWAHLAYIDLLAGPGESRIRGSGEILKGSPLIALEFDFDEFIFFEKEAGLADALRQRLADHPKEERCDIRPEPWEQAVKNGNLVCPSGLSLAFLDPTGISQVPWTALATLVKSSDHLDILMTIQHALGIKRNQRRYVGKEKTALARWLGDDSLAAQIQEPRDVWPVALKAYTAKMASLGYRTTKWMPVELPSGASLYYICLFSRHPRALSFWHEITKKDELGQTSLDLR